MRANFAAHAVLERRDDFAASGVVLGIGGEDQQHVQRQANGVALNLHVAFLHDIEKAHLDFAGEIGQFVDGEDAAVGARKQAVVHGQLVGKIPPAARGLDGIDVADDVGDGHVGRGQFFDEAVFAREPGDGRVVALLGHNVAASPADGVQRMIVNLASGDIGNFRFEEIHQAAQDAALGLSAQAQQDEVVPRQDGVGDLRQHRLFVAADAGKERLARFQLAQQVAAHLILHAAIGGARTGYLPPLTDRGWFHCRGFGRHKGPLLCRYV